jgi:hypothetical protein
MHWLEVSITFDISNHPDYVPHLTCYVFILSSTVGDTSLRCVLINGGNNLNIIFAKTFKKMWLLGVALRSSLMPFYGIILGRSSSPLGQIALHITFISEEKNLHQVIGLRGGRHWCSTPCYYWKARILQIYDNTTLHFYFCRTGKATRGGWMGANRIFVSKHWKLTLYFNWDEVSAQTINTLANEWSHDDKMFIILTWDQRNKQIANRTPKSPKRSNTVSPTSAVFSNTKFCSWVQNRTKRTPIDMKFYTHLSK